MFIMKKLTLIIVMPVYNEQDNIEKVLEEILVQLDFKNFLIIILNDGSTDATLKKLE